MAKLLDHYKIYVFSPVSAITSLCRSHIDLENRFERFAPYSKNRAKEKYCQHTHSNYSLIDLLLHFPLWSPLEECRYICNSPFLSGRGPQNFRVFDKCYYFRSRYATWIACPWLFPLIFFVENIDLGTHPFCFMHSRDNCGYADTGCFSGGLDLWDIFHWLSSRHTMVILMARVLQRQKVRTLWLIGPWCQYIRRFGWSSQSKAIKYQGRVHEPLTIFREIEVHFDTICLIKIRTRDYLCNCRLILRFLI